MKALVCTLVAGVLAGGPACAGGEQNIYSFQGGTDGRGPAGALTADPAGNLYGVTTSGGRATRLQPDCCGTVYQLVPSGGGVWSENVIHRFSPALDGTGPVGTLLWKAGALYGAAESGGGNGCGAIFRLTSPPPGSSLWREKLLYSFGCPYSIPPNEDGYEPNGDLIADALGNLFGTTSIGGAASAGTVFELSPPAAGQTEWTEKILSSFDGAGGGAYPLNGVVAGANGALFGVTPQRGAGYGVIFELIPPAPNGSGWSERVLHSFSGGADGSVPIAPLFVGGGALYGTTNAGGARDCSTDLAGSPGCGVVFRLAPPAAAGDGWSFRVIHTFHGLDGATPLGGLAAMGGELYGTTGRGGTTSLFCSNGCGTIFSLIPPAARGAPWTESVLWNSPGIGNSVPNFNLLPAAGSLFGINLDAPVDDPNALGAVFQFTP